jgi:hypothetical protein
LIVSLSVSATVVLPLLVNVTVRATASLWKRLSSRLPWPLRVTVIVVVLPAGTVVLLWATTTVRPCFLDVRDAVVRLLVVWHFWPAGAEQISLNLTPLLAAFGEPDSRTAVLTLGEATVLPIKDPQAEAAGLLVAFPA